jgi:hypothetical protein
VQFSSADIGPALTLLASMGLLVRPETGLGQPRPGHLPTDADKATEVPAAIRLGRLVISVSQTVERLNDNRATQQQIADALLAADEEVGGKELSRTLRQLCDCGQMVQVRRFDTAPMTYVSSGQWPFDAVDLLEADVCQVLRDRPDAIGFEDETQLRDWLSAAGIEGFSDREFSQAIGHLIHLGHLQSPRADQWEHPGPRPTWLNEPRVRTG